jgi:hypothetical protein
MAYNATPILATQKRPRLGLLSVASLLPSDLDWRRGVRYSPEGCVLPDTYDLCGPGAGPKPDPEIPGYYTFNPFIVAAVDGCQDPWALDPELRERAQRNMLMAQGSMVAKELLDSSVGNPSLSSTATDVSGGAAVDWEAGARTLLFNMQAAGYVGDVVLHAPTWMQPSFEQSGIGTTEDGTRRPFVGTHPVVFDAGYAGDIPPDTLGGPDSSDPGTAAWIYATGPVEYAFAQELDEISVTVDTRQNERYVLAERPAIVRFDACQVFGVVVGANA